MKIFRLAAYVVLFALVLNLSDWPFVDEILAENTSQQGREVSSDEVGFKQNEKSFKPQQSSGDSRPAASIYQSLTNFVDMPSHRLALSTDCESPTYSATEKAFVSAIPPPLERPPRTSLS